MRNIIPRYLGIDDQLIHAALQQARDVRDAAREDDGRGTRLVTRRMHAWRYYIRRLITEQPFIYRVIEGTITAVNVGDKTCSVVINDEPGSFSDVNYYPPSQVPNIGDIHAVHEEIRIPTRTMQEDTEKELVERWIKQYRVGWIYRKFAGESALIRYQWPPPGPDEPWIIEIIQDDLDLSWRLFGASTAVGEHTQIVMENNAGASYFVEGSDGPEVSFGRHYYHLDEMGAGDLVKDYDVDPVYVDRLLAIANDGVNTAGTNTVQTTTQLDGGESWVPRHEVLDSTTCCASDPDDLQEDCITQTNYQRVFDIVPGSIPDHETEHTVAIRLRVGVLGETTIVVTLDQPWEILESYSPPQQLVEAYCTATGCHWVEGFNITVWNDLTCIDTYYPSPDVAGNQNVNHVGVQFFPAELAGAWAYDGIPTTALAYPSINNYYDEESIQDVLPSRSSQPIILQNGEKWWVRAFGGVVGTYNWDMYVDMENALDYREPRAFSLKTNGTLITWWWQQRDSEDYDVICKTENGGALQPLDIYDLTAVSREGNNVIGWLVDENGERQVYSLDGGETWVDMPPVASDLVPENYIPTGVMFLDEVA